MTSIWKHNPWYSLLRPVVDLCTRRSFRRFKTVGNENIPKDGAIILAPNHCNALMDPLVVGYDFKGPIVFGARADIFDNPFVAKMLTFLRILPMVRKRDGIRKVLRNYETIQSATEVLCNGVPFCMFSEGTHRAMRSLMPITKGIVRVAAAANEELAGSRPVYILPAGLEYGDYFHFRSTCLVSYGEPINITEYFLQHADQTEAEVYTGIRSLIFQRLTGLITYIPDDEMFASRWALVQAWVYPLRGSSPTRLKISREAAARSLDAPEELLQRALAWDEARQKAKIEISAFGRPDIVVRLVNMIIGLPFFLLSAVLTLPMWLAGEIISHKIEDRAFRNTVKYSAGFAGMLLMPFVWAIVLFINFRWFIALPILLYFFISYSLFYDYLGSARIMLSQIRLFARPDLRKEYKAIRKTWVK